MFQYHRQHNLLATETPHFPFSTRAFFKTGSANILPGIENIVFSFTNGSDYIHLYSYGSMQDFVDLANVKLLVKSNNEVVGRNIGYRVWHRIPSDEQNCYYGIIEPRANVTISLLFSGVGAAFDSSIWIAGVYSKFKGIII